jgi:hypothetical protein
MILFFCIFKVSTKKEFKLTLEGAAVGSVIKTNIED